MRSWLPEDGKKETSSRQGRVGDRQGGQLIASVSNSSAGSGRTAQAAAAPHCGRRRRPGQASPRFLAGTSWRLCSRPPHSSASWPAAGGGRSGAGARAFTATPAEQLGGRQRWPGTAAALAALHRGAMRTASTTTPWHRRRAPTMAPLRAPCLARPPPPAHLPLLKQGAVGHNPLNQLGRGHGVGRLQLPAKL